LARSFAAMARKAEETSRTVLVPKQPDPHPPLPIHQLGATELRSSARRISKVDESVRDLARDMLRSMYSAKGIGLAAPQVGVPKQLLVINPEITAAGASCSTYEEGCLSIPGVYLQVVRPSVVEVGFRDEFGRPRRLKVDGLLARCIQHEMDHLKGVLFVDRVTDELALNDELRQHGFRREHVQSIR
jgi:peptide deformylase